MPRRSSPRIPLPADLASAPFGVARARGVGLGRRRLEGGDLERPFHGARRVAGGAASLWERCLAFEARAPAGTFFCGATAAALFTLPLPPRIAIEGVPLEVGVAAPRRALRAAGINGRSVRIGSAELLRVNGVWVTDPARTWRDLAPLLSVPELVAVGDHLVHYRWPLVSVEQLQGAALTAGRRSGAHRLRAAAALLDTAAESPMESLVRSTLVLGGLPAPVSNLWVQLPGVRKRYRLDMAYPGAKLDLEYQGGYHHDEAQWKEDMTRASRLRAHGWTVIELNSRDLHDPRELVDRIRRFLAAACG